MASDGDPYRTLGLPPGAPLTDVKRAYRRLAKANHPDTAGDAAMQRFLAIQAAYEALVGGDSRGRRRPGAARPAPWAADPERTRATRDTWQRRSARPPDPASDDGGGADAGAGPGAGASAAGPGAGAGPGASGPPPGSGTRRRRPGGGARRPGADRAPDRATPGSTSYDFADQEAFEPEWSGASWYGQSSGTFWTINPKEYADPRKHGPEYQARGRRREDPDGAVPPPDPIDASAETYATAPGPRPPDAPDAPEPPEAAGSPGAPGARDARGAPDSRGAPGARDARGGPEAAGSPGSAPRSRQPRAAAPTPPPPPARTPLTREQVARGPVAPLPIATMPWTDGPGGRIGLALIGWPPIGLALALLLGELSGCARLAATCVEGASIGGWVAQVAIVGLLFLVPALAPIAASGTVAILAAAIPTVVILTAVGGAYDRVTSGSVLLVTLAIAWAIGVGFAVLRRSRTVPP